jgi:hypothetical protein
MSAPRDPGLAAPRREGGTFRATPALSTEHLAPVGLDELVGSAELLTRVDRKYLLPIEVAAAALAAVDPSTRVLEIEQTREFAYHSVYFDTEEATLYRLTAQRRRRRIKVRTRSYLGTGACFLEVKTKSGRGTTVKQRIAYEPADRTRLTTQGREYTRAVLGDEGHDRSLADRLQPSLVSEYHRTTLLLPEGARATFDTGLSWLDPRRPTGVDDRSGTRPTDRVCLPHHAVVETKSAGGVSTLDRALWRAGHRPTAISKFGTGTAALHPELPSNTWARSLRGPFARPDWSAAGPASASGAAQQPHTRRSDPA